METVLVTRTKDCFYDVKIADLGRKKTVVSIEAYDLAAKDGEWCRTVWSISGNDTSVPGEWRNIADEALNA